MSESDSLYVGGNFTTYDSQPASRIIKLNDDGTRDFSFVYGAGFNDVVWDVLEQPDGKIVVIGAFTIYNTIPAAGIIRLNPDGTRKLQIKFSDGSWKDFPRLSQEQSNDFGRAIRNYHLTLLASDHGAEDDHQIC